MNPFFTVISELERSLNNIVQAQPFNIAIHDQPIDSESLENLINSVVSEGNKHHSQTWAAHMTAPISAASMFGQLVASLHNGNLLSASLYPVLATIEKQLLSWFSQLFHQPYGHFTSGSTYGNLEALWQAKKHSTTSRIVYASTAAHYSIAKACQILDLELRLIETNDHDQLIPSALEAACRIQTPLAIIATLGTSAAGVIDPIAACCDIAKRVNAWCHIDAAWGGALAILPEYQSLFALCGQADSICFDPHKGWQQPKPAGVLLYKKNIEPMLSFDTNYLETTPLNSLVGSHGGELFLALWFDLIINGVDALSSRLKQRLEQANAFSDMLAVTMEFELYRSETGIVCFSLKPMSALNTLVDQGMISKAKIAGKPVYRTVFSHHYVQAESLMNEIAKNL
ncbi:MAG: aminotransferase class V-fold PLP-dependent enzyme [Gammaproteobacteria bacterium]|nr:aminotransferase class V-fold PLP-dependent enzyme [Gammaproteobacteria bacterium]